MTMKGKGAMGQVFGKLVSTTVSFWKEAVGEKIPAQCKCAALDGRECSSLEVFQIKLDNFSVETW